MPIEITDPADERVRDYFALTDVALRTKVEPPSADCISRRAKRSSGGLSPPDIDRARMAGHWLTDLADLVEQAESECCPV